MADSKKFEPVKFDKSDCISTGNNYDLNSLYKSAQAELTLQQSKRDQILVIYLAIASFIIPFSYSLSALNAHAKGLIYLAVGIIGIMFTLISVRYRIYKEVYWLCCESITCLMSFKQEKIDKPLIQSVFYACLKKKGSGYVKTVGDKKRWNGWQFFKKNIFSSETLYFLILAFVTAILVGLSFLMLVIQAMPFYGALLVAIGAGLVVIVILISKYFKKCGEVYAVLVDEKNSSFNKTFGKAWFLHMYVDDYDIFTPAKPDGTDKQDV